MTSNAKIAANRKNARRSSGPKTVAGKSRARLNATRHGLASAKNGSEELLALALGLLNEVSVSQVNARRLEHAMILAESELDLQRVQDARISIVERMTMWPQSQTGSTATLDQHEPQATINAEALHHTLLALQKLHRYERSAWAKRNRSIPQLVQISDDLKEGI